MRQRLDPASPLPLYHQLAEALRYQIATGSLPRGRALPSLREAARRWGVNLHTVRHAYAALAAQGLVRTEVPRGTVVLGGRGRPVGRSGELDRFLSRIVREAAEHHGLPPEELARRVASFGTTGGVPDQAYVIECSETQASELAQQVSAAWRVRAEGWSLERPGEPPPGQLVATYFHYNDIRARWPERFAQVRFVPIHPDPALARQLASFRRGARRVTVRVCEREAAMLRNIVADLTSVLPADRFRLDPVLEPSAGSALTATPRGVPILFAPRVWGLLTPEQRADGRAFEIRYLIEPKDLAALGAELQWRSAA
jgi:DNA-binding transcriptional regulator YhcF (GntR family)